MAASTPSQVRTRERVESVIKLMAPALDLLLVAGDRVSRVIERDDTEYYPPRLHHEQPPPRVAAGRGDQG